MLTLMTSSVILVTGRIGHIAFGNYFFSMEQRVEKKVVGKSQILVSVRNSPHIFDGNF